jgi:hypothetical protein
VTPSDDLDGQATSGRADRPRNHRTRLAGRIIARAAWLDAPLVFWTGERQDVPVLADAVLPVRALLQDRLADLQAGLYAVSIGFPGNPVAGAELAPPRPPRAATRRRQGSARAPAAAAVGGPLGLEVTAVHAVTRELVADTARAIEAAARFPRAAARLVGPVNRWRQAALTRLDTHRRAVNGATAWRTGAPEALAVEARALWLGAGPAPSATLPEPALVSWTTHPVEREQAAARLAAVALGRRHAAAACNRSLAAWAAAGRALDRWPAAAVAWAATAVGAETLASLAAAWPALGDALGAVWVEERRIDSAPTSGDEIAGLAHLLAIVAAVRSEPARRHALLCQLAIQYLQIAWSRGRGWGATTPEAVAEPFRDLVLERVYGEVRDLATARRHRVPDCVAELAGRWLGEELLDRQTFAYVDNLLAGAAVALGRHDMACVFPDAPTNLSERVPPGSALDPAGGAVVVAVADRLRRKGAADPSDTMARWLETCRPLIPLGTFWRDTLSITPSGSGQLEAEHAVRLVESIRCHGRTVAAELVFGEQDKAVRALLPAALARGPNAVDRVLRRNLWLPDEDALDAALRWVEAVETLRPAAGADSIIPIPRDVFVVEDPDLRLALVGIGLRIWDKIGEGAQGVENLLEMLARAVSQGGTKHWSAALPRLGEVAALLASRMLSAPGQARLSLVAGAPLLVLVILDACARWESAGFGDTIRLARILADRWRSAAQADQEWSREDGDRDELIVQLSEGRIPRFLTLVQHPPAPRKFAWRAVDGWALAQSHPMARAWLSACLDRTELITRVVLLLERLALVARLEPGLTAARFFEPLERVPDAAPAWPGWVPPDAVTTLDQIARARTLAAALPTLPGGLRRLLDGPATVGAELGVLRARAGARTMTPSERARLDKIERLVADPRGHTADLCAELRRALPKQLALAGLAALESLVKHDLDRRWRTVLGGDAVSLGGPAWDNALHMLGTVRHNRRVLRRLLRHAARNDRVWMRALGPNRAFLDHLAALGLQPAEWLAERSRIVGRPTDPVQAYATVDPLEVLQMGSLFGTCLSAGKFNAHAAVAAAVEANKRVLFVKDGAGRVLGRQLIALTRDGEIVGFTCYGAAAVSPERHGAWVTLALELLALDIARATGARLMSRERVSSGLDEADEQSLMLFCRGYVDSLESFDWWIGALAAANPRSSDGDRALLRSLLEGPVSPDRDARACPAWQREDLGWAACRAMLWLGAEAPSLSTDQAEALGLGEPQRVLLGMATREG